MFKQTFILLFFIISPVAAGAQEILFDIANDSIKEVYESAMKEKNIFKPMHIYMSEDEAIRILDKYPAFAVYRDTYFMTGIPLNEKITNTSADAAFQVSIRHRLTKTVLPLKTFAYLTYTQKSFWDIYAESSPFRDTNYNPGIGLGKTLFLKNRVVGAAFFQIKHESNGQDGDKSRSWNYLSFSAKYYFNPRFNISGELWAPFVDGGNNRDLIDYKGLGNFIINYTSYKHKWWLSAELNPRKGLGNINTILTASFRMSEKSNLYLYGRYFNGYGESLLDYNRYTASIRFGICIKPDFYSIY
jgi:Outer membrane phospholipase A